MTIQGPPGNNSNHPEPIRGNGNASRAHQVPFTTPHPVDHLLGKLFKYLTRCGHGACTVRILPLSGFWPGAVYRVHTGARGAILFLAFGGMRKGADCAVRPVGAVGKPTTTVPYYVLWTPHLSKS